MKINIQFFSKQIHGCFRGVALLLILLSFAQQMYAQTIISPTTWGGSNTTTSAGPSNFSPLPATSAPGATAVTISEWNRGSGVNYNAGANRYNSSNWYVAGTTSVSTAYANNKYVYFTITNNSATELSITNIDVISGQASGTGPTTFGMMYQIGTGTASVFTASAAGPSPSFTGTAYLCGGQTATFYLCGWGGTGTSGTWSIGSSGSPSSPVSITAYYAPALTIGSSSATTPVVAGSTLTFTGGIATPGVSPYSYAWSGPLGFTSSLQDPSITSVTLGASGSYVYSVTDAYNCSLTDTVSVAVIADVPCSGTPLGGTATPVTSSFCGSGSTVINVTGGSALTGLSYQWFSSSSTTGPFTAIPGATLTTYTTPSLTSSTTYYLLTTCTATGDTAVSSTTTVSVNPVPGGISTPFGTNIIDLGAAVLLTDTTTGYTTGWISGSPAIATVDGTGMVTGISAGTANITYSVTNSFGCTGYSAPFLVTVNPYTYCVPSPTSSGDGVGITTTGAISNITAYSQVAAYNNRTTTLGIDVIPGSTVSYTVTNPSTYSTTYYSSMWIDWNHSYTFGDSTSEEELTSHPVTYSGGTYSGSFTVPTTAQGGFTVMRLSMGESSSSLYSAPCGSGYGSVVDFYVHILPTITLGASPTACEGATATQTYTSLGGSATEYYIIWSSTALAAGFTNVTSTPIGSSILIPTPTSIPGLSSTTGYTGTLYVTNGAYAGLGTPITVNVMPAVTAGPISGSSLLCMPATLSLTDSASGGAWSSNDTTIATVSSTGVVAGSTSGTAVISYSISSCGSSVVTFPVTVLPTPVAGTISGISTLCEGSIVTFTDSVTGGTWSSSTSVVTVNLLGDVNPVDTGEAIISYTLSNACGTATATHSVTVSPLPLSGIISGTTHLCVGGSVGLSDTIAGGLWSSSLPSVATVDGLGSVTGVDSGITTISYEISNVCGSSTSTISVTVNSAPTAAVITGTSTLCEGTVATFTSTIPGGVWGTNDSTIASVSDSGLVSAIATGSTIISYVLTNSCGTASTTQMLTINLLPSAGTISGPASICNLSTGSFSDGVPSGTWSSSSTSIASVNPTGVATAIAPGVDSILYTVTSTCGTAIAYTLVTVDPLPTSGIVTGATILCPSDTTSYTATVSGGVWSVANTSIAQIDSISGLAVAIANGVTNISYTITSACGTANSSITLTVNPTPNAGAITGPSNLCVGTSGTYSSSVPGGTWTVTNVSAALPVPGVLTAMATGTDTIIYTVTNSCGSSSDSTVVTLNGLPVVGPISGSASICSGDSTALADTTLTGTWSSAAIGISTVSGTGIVTGVTSGMTTISFTATNLCGSSSALFPVTINALPNAGTITGTGTLCSGANITLSTTGSGGVWNSSDVGVATVSSTGVVSGGSVGVDSIIYSVTNGCGTSIAMHTVSVNGLPSVSPLTATGTICQLAAETATDTTSGGSWNSSNPAVASIDAFGNITAGIPGTSVISYSLSNGCGTTAATASISVEPLPNSGVITGITNVCTGSSVTLNDASAGGSWTSSVPSVATVDTNGIVSGLTTGNAMISYTVSNSCGSATSSVAVTVGIAPTVDAISGTSAICLGTSATFSDATLSGSWSSENPLVAMISSSGLVFGYGAGSTVISYTVINACGSSGASFPVTINALPLPISGPLSLCMGYTFTYTDATSSGTWTSSNSLVATIDPVSGSLNALSAGLTDISYTAPITGCYVSEFITVSPLPNAGIISGSTSVCAGSSITLSDGAPGGSWMTSNAHASVISGVVSGISAGMDTIKYQVTNGCGTASTSRVVTVNGLPSVAAISGPTQVCAGGTISLSDSTTSGSWTISNPSAVISGGIVTALYASLDTVAYTVSGICGNSSVNYVVTINPLPFAISGSDSLCAGSYTTLTNSSTGTWISGDTTVATINPVTGSLFGVDAGSCTITFTLPTGCLTTSVVSVNSAPGSISGPSAICVGLSAHFTDTSSGMWALSNPDATISSTSGVVTGMVPGIDTVMFIAAHGCTSYSILTLNPTPLSLSGPTQLCAGSTITLVDTSAGGVWSATNASVIIDSLTGEVMGMIPGADTIVYRFPDGCGTSNIVAIDSLPGNITGIFTLCPLATSTLSELVAGTWSVTNPNATIDAVTGVVTGAVSGTDTVVFTTPQMCATTAVITIDLLPWVAPIQGLTNVCTGNILTLNDTTVGGTWFATNGKAAVTGGLVSGITSGSDTIGYSITNSCGTALAQITVTVMAPPAVSPISGPSSVCVSSMMTVSDTNTVGTWTSQFPSIATISADGIITGVAAGQDTIMYMAANACGTAEAFLPISVDTLALTNISGINYVCANKTDTLSGMPAGGNWRATNMLATVSGGVITGVDPGFDTIYYSVTNVCGSDSSRMVLPILSKSECDSINLVGAVFVQPGTFEIVPNPGYSDFSVKITTDNQIKSVCKVINSIGETVVTFEMESNNEQFIHIPGPAGMYILSAQSGAAHYSSRIIKLD